MARGGSPRHRHRPWYRPRPGRPSPVPARPRHVPSGNLTFGRRSVLKDPAGTLFVILVIAFSAPLIVSLAPWLRLPALVLEILFGILVGPDVLDLVEVTEPISLLSELGIATLIFLAGFEVDPARLQGRPLRLALGGWGLSIVIGLAAGAVLQATGVISSELYVGSGAHHHRTRNPPPDPPRRRDPGHPVRHPRARGRVGGRVRPDHRGGRSAQRRPERCARSRPWSRSGWSRRWPCGWRPARRPPRFQVALATTLTVERPALRPPRDGADRRASPSPPPSWGSTSSSGRSRRASCSGC